MSNQHIGGGGLGHIGGGTRSRTKLKEIAKELKKLSLLFTQLSNMPIGSCPEVRKSVKSAATGAAAGHIG